MKVLTLIHFCMYLPVSATTPDGLGRWADDGTPGVRLLISHCLVQSQGLGERVAPSPDAAPSTLPYSGKTLRGRQQRRAAIWKDRDTAMAQMFIGTQKLKFIKELYRVHAPEPRSRYCVRTSPGRESFRIFTKSSVDDLLLYEHLKAVISYCRRNIFHPLAARSEFSRR